MKKQFIKKLGFLPKENSNNIFFKKYNNDYILEVDFEKEVTNLSNEEFNNKFGGLSEEVRIELLKEFNKIRLEKNIEFAIKDVFDKETFEENAIVLKEVVELLQKYQIRYEEKQPFLGDFFELLLTTGLKQEAGQFFTPVPVAKFICKSIPIEGIIKDKLEKGDGKDLLPSVIDYAAGSDHFLTESMEEIQSIIYGLQRGQAQPHVYGDDLSLIKIPLPTLENQKKIVAEIEILEKEIEELKGKNKNIPEKKKKILTKYL